MEQGWPTGARLQGWAGLDLTLYYLWKISKLTSLFKPGFVCERQRGEEIMTEQRGEEITTEQGEGCVQGQLSVLAASQSRGPTRVAVHSSREAVKLCCPGTVMIRTVCRVLSVDTCDDPVEDSNVRDLLGKAVGAAYQGIYYAEGAAVQEKTATLGTCCMVETVGAAYQGSSTLKEQQFKRRQQCQGLAGEGCRSSILREYHAGGAAVEEMTAMSGTCWSACSLGAFNWIRNFYAKEQR